MLSVNLLCIQLTSNNTKSKYKINNSDHYECIATMFTDCCKCNEEICDEHKLISNENIIYQKKKVST